MFALAIWNAIGEWAAKKPVFTTVALIASLASMWRSDSFLRLINPACVWSANFAGNWPLMNALGDDQAAIFFEFENFLEIQSFRDALEASLI
jgi:hypothetical protein